MTRSIFIGNYAGNEAGGGVFVGSDTTVTIEDSSFTQNSAGFGGAFYTQGDTHIRRSTFFDNGGSRGAQLADNGGPTLTHLPGALSIAIDGGQCDVEVIDDQRGIARPQRLACDSGAVEVETESTAVCGDPVAVVATRPATVSASDSLAILNAGVGLYVCELCVCDVDDSGAISATDALATLRNAVGLGTELTCPACG